MLTIVTAVQAFLLCRARPPCLARLTLRRRREDGQATAEYALVLLGAAAIALILVAWATKSGRIGKLFDTVFDALMDKVK